MRRSLLCVYTILLLCSSIAHIDAQSEDLLSKNIAKGVAELRADVFLRKQTYAKQLNEILSSLDSSSMKEDQKKATHDFIRNDIQTGGKFNSLDLYDLLPKNSPFKNIFIEQFTANNQDYQIDKDFVYELTNAGILTTEGKIGRPKLEELKKDFEFLGINKDDRLLLYNAGGAAYAMLLGYAFEGVDITIHNRYLRNHYMALDRADRYPNINNGNSIDFLNLEDARLMVKAEQWDKIVIRETKILERGAGVVLKSFHDNLSQNGHLYILHEVGSDEVGCNGRLTEESITKITQRSEFRLIDKIKMGCHTYFKFRSTQE